MSQISSTEPMAFSTTHQAASRADMYYLIHTPHHPRPYLSTVSFVANDFAKWGCRVTRHAKGSPYITEIRYQETRNRPTSRRIELMEVWAKEVLARKQQGTPPPPTTPEASTLEARKEKASAFVQDFVSSLSRFESPFKAPKSLQNDPLPLPAYPLALIARHTRLLKRCAYITHATLPSWSPPDVLVADQITLEFRFDKSLKREQLAHALREAIGNGEGRMGRVEKCGQTGLTRVCMWVDVGGLVIEGCGKGAAGEEDPVPVYEKGEWVWPPGYEERVC